MSQGASQGLFFVVLAVFGVYGVRWTQRLAPLWSELPLKTLLAALLCGLFGGLALSGNVVTPFLLWTTLVIGPLYVLAPFALTALARGRLYGFARTLAYGLYWSNTGRTGISRLIALVALRQDDPEAALEGLPEGEGDVLRLQAYALQERWPEVLALPVAEGGDNALLGSAARVQALLALGDEAAAAEELTDLEARWQEQGQGPLGYRALTLSKARLYAYRGDVAAARSELQTPLPGVPPYRVLEILAFAAERAYKPQAAGKLYAQAHAYAPPRHKPRLEEALARYDQDVPAAKKPSRPIATFALALFLGALYGVQLWAAQRYGNANAWVAAGGFLTLRPGAPGGDALWRYLSYAFVHGGLLHIGLNLWVLVDIGRLYETRRAWGNLLVAFVFGSAMGAYLTFIVQGGSGPPGVVGASGGVLGVGGALLADVLRGRGAGDRMLTRSLLQWIGFIVIFSLAIPNVSLWGHVGGLLGGLLWGFARQGLPKSPRIDQVAGVVSVLLLGYALFGALNWLFTYGGR